MYDRIASNVRKSWALMFGFVLIIVGIGLVFSWYTDLGYWPVLIAFGFAMLMTWGSYFSSDKIALSMSRAKPADGPAYVQLHNIVEGLSLAAGIPKPRVY